MRRFSITAIFCIALFLTSCDGCANGWKRVYDNNAVEQVNSHQQVGWNYYLLFPGYRYIPTWTTV